MKNSFINEYVKCTVIALENHSSPSVIASNRKYQNYDLLFLKNKVFYR